MKGKFFFLNFVDYSKLIFKKLLYNDKFKLMQAIRFSVSFKK